jgi:hypothetical protein
MSEREVECLIGRPTEVVAEYKVWKSGTLELWLRFNGDDHLDREGLGRTDGYSGPIVVQEEGFFDRFRRWPPW